MTEKEKAILQLTMLIDLFNDLSVNSNCVSVLLGREDEQALKTAIEALQENESLARTVNEASELLHKKRPHGTWKPIVNDIDLSKCSECGCVTGEQYLFCPNCGADMRGDAE